MAALEWQTKRPMLKAFPVLILSGETEHRERLARAVSGCGLRPVCCGTFAAAKVLIAHQQFRVVLSEDLLPDGDFRAVIGETTRNEGKLPVVVVSRLDDWDCYLAAMSAGAFDYVAFPPNLGEVERILYAALSESRWSERAVAHRAA
jgi:DNA-binding NtrC family response regulator